MEREELLEQLATAEESLRFLVVIIAGILLSFRAAQIQRDGICARIAGEEPDLSEVYPIRHTANSLIVGALGFFLCLAIKNRREADCEGAGSAQSNLWAAALVFAAALVRFDDLENSANG